MQPIFHHRIAAWKSMISNPDTKIQADTLNIDLNRAFNSRGTRRFDLEPRWTVILDSKQANNLHSIAIKWLSSTQIRCYQTLSQLIIITKILNRLMCDPFNVRSIRILYDSIRKFHYAVRESHFNFLLDIFLNF